MIELPKMAELMDDHIIKQSLRQIDKLVVEIKIFLHGATPPSGLLVL
jgi:hypothetical protein